MTTLSMFCPGMLDENHGKISRTAEVLGLERSHLYRKMKALQIAVKE